MDSWDLSQFIDFGGETMGQKWAVDRGKIDRTMVGEWNVNDLTGSAYGRESYPNNCWFLGLEISEVLRLVPICGWEIGKVNFGFCRWIFFLVSVQFGLAI